MGFQGRKGDCAAALGGHWAAWGAVGSGELLEAGLQLQVTFLPLRRGGDLSSTQAQVLCLALLSCSLCRWVASPRRSRAVH